MVELAQQLDAERAARTSDATAFHTKMTHLQNQAEAMIRFADPQSRLHLFYLAPSLAPVLPHICNLNVLKTGTVLACNCSISHM